MTEHAEQMAVVEWKLWQINLGNWAEELGLLFAIPNGGYRADTTALKLKAEGVVSGVPDLCLPVPRGGYHGLYIEMKTKGGEVRTNQWEWIAALRRQGYRTVVCWNSEQAIAELEWYLSLRKETKNANSKEDLAEADAQAARARAREATRKPRSRARRAVQPRPW